MKPVVLIADASAPWRDLVRRALAEHGCEVETATDGLDCLERLRRVKPAVLVLDFDLRWGGGDGILAWLRENGSAGSISVILTAWRGPRPVSQSLQPPVVCCLWKPFSLTKLAQTVRSALEAGGRGRAFANWPPVIPVRPESDTVAHDPAHDVAATRPGG
jgi:CheY-like chemotaxis protein